MQIKFVCLHQLQPAPVATAQLRQQQPARLPANPKTAFLQPRLARWALLHHLPLPSSLTLSLPTHASLTRPRPGRRHLAKSACQLSLVQLAGLSAHQLHKLAGV